MPEGYPCERPNRLAGEQSPYLRQHACNPVDWHPWGDEALRRAGELGKPLLVSIGYSTCHWCHVMARESFEDPDVAGVLNRVFVPVKVDREERPDIDEYYMSFCMATVGSCGWPLNVVALPDGRPFYAFTYLPREDLVRLAQAIEKYWAEGRGEVEESARRASRALSALLEEAGEGDLGVGDYRECYLDLYRSFDPLYGGFGEGAKFPYPIHMLFLLRYWRRTGDGDALAMVSKTLGHMLAGGMHDLVDGGFHRYTVDRAWLLPHFEKMLYDQASILMVLAEAHIVEGRREYLLAMKWAAEFLAEHMRSGGGAFYSAMDSESEGVEGKYYTWTLDEVAGILSGEELSLARRLFNLRERGNYREERSGEYTGRNVLYIGMPLEDAARSLGMDLRELLGFLERARARLKAARRARVRPRVDEKVLVDWNGLAIAGLSKAYYSTGDGAFLELAEGAAGHILREALGEGALLHIAGAGRRVEGMLGDYSSLAWGLAELYVASHRHGYLEAARDVALDMVRLFWDDSSKVFRLGPRGSGSPARNVISTHDSSTPSPYGVAVYSLIKLSRLLGEPGLEEIARKALRGVALRARRAPSSHPMLMISLDYLEGPSFELVVVGPRGDRAVGEMLSIFRSVYAPNHVSHLVPPDPEAPIRSIAPYTRSMVMVGGRPTAYLCVDYTCDLPVNDAGSLRRLLESRLRPGGPGPK